MAPVTATAFVLFGAALLLMGRRSAQARAAGSALATAGLLLMTVVLLSHLFGLRTLRHLGLHTVVALPTSLGLIALLTGTLTLAPDAGWPRWLQGDSLGAASARALLPAIVLGPIALAWVAQQGVRAGLYDTDVRLALTTLGTVVLLTAVMLRTIPQLDRLEAARRRSEAALTASEARCRAIVDTAADALVVIDERGSIQSLNRAAERIFGYAAEELLGQDVRRLMPEPYRSAHDAYFERYARTGERRVIGIGQEVQGRRKDGTTFPMELAVAEWQADSQRFFTGIMRDITERREAQRRLEESNALLATIIESIPDPVFAKDRDGRYLLANAGTCAVSGAAHARVLGARDRDLYLPEIATAIEAVDQRVLRTGETVVLEEAAPHRTRGQRVFLTTKAPLHDSTGRITGLVGLSLDITERKRAEEGLRAATAEAERANRAKSKFLAAASHDLRQPAQSLLFFFSLLRERAKGRLDTRLLGSMEQALDALKMLLDSLLDVSRLDAGLVAAQPTSVPVLPLLERLVAEHRQRAQAAGLRLRLVGCSAVVRSDPVLLERMLRHLLENSLRYTRQGGILLGCRRGGDRLRLEVIDTGIGIAPEQLEAVFEEFYQIDNPERDRMKGLGLGLAVVRRLARLLGHEVEVRSVPGRGSVFAILLPLVRRAEPLAQPPNLLASADTGTVVVIEDDFLIRMGLEAMLQGWGYAVLGAGSVEEAIRLVQHGPAPDAIVTDYRLPAGTTGLDGIRAVHACLGRAIPATIVTGDTAPERLAEANRGGFRLLHKPVAPADLRRAVASMLRESRGTG
jgi:PAS domain S-box-containing protein